MFQIYVTQKESFIYSSVLNSIILNYLIFPFKFSFLLLLRIESQEMNMLSYFTIMLFFRGTNVQIVSTCWQRNNNCKYLRCTSYAFLQSMKCQSCLELSVKIWSITSLHFQYMSKSVLHCLLTPTIDSDTGKKQTKQNKN